MRGTGNNLPIRALHDSAFYEKPPSHTQEKGGRKNTQVQSSSSTHSNHLNNLTFVDQQEAWRSGYTSESDVPSKLSYPLPFAGNEPYADNTKFASHQICDQDTQTASNYHSHLYNITCVDQQEAWRSGYTSESDVPSELSDPLPFAGNEPYADNTKFASHQICDQDTQTASNYRSHLYNITCVDQQEAWLSDSRSELNSLSESSFTSESPRQLLFSGNDPYVDNTSQVTTEENADIPIKELMSKMTALFMMMMQSMMNMINLNNLKM